MSLTGSSPLAVVRAGLWGLLLFTAVSWLAIGWSVLRLEPSNMAVVAGAVILFGALTEVLRACARTRTWWLNAGLAVLFAATSAVLLTAPETHTTPAALIGWYLMVRGTVDVAVAVLTRESDRVWGLLMVVGALEAGLGFFAASPLSRTADLLVTIVGALGLLRAVADLVTALRIREVRAARSKVLHLPPERALGLAGYTAGLTDYESVPARGAPRHRAVPAGLAGAPVRGTLSHRGVLSDRGALSRVRYGSERWAGAAPGAGSASASRIGAGSEPEVLAEIEPADEIGYGSGPNDSMWPGGPAAVLAAAAGNGTAADMMAGRVSAIGGMAGGVSGADGATGGVSAADGTPGGVSAVGATAGWVSAADGTAGWVSAADGTAGGVSAAGGMAAEVDGSGRPADAFHAEVLRTTADLDAILALAGMTGAGMGAHLGFPDDYVVPQVPDTPEGVESPRRGGVWRGSHAEPDGGLPVLDEAGQVARDSDVSAADGSIIAGVRRSI